MSRMTMCAGFVIAIAALAWADTDSDAGAGAGTVTFPMLAQRLPASANAIIAVNVDKLVQSPYGQKAQWGERLADAWAKQPLMIPPGALRLIMAADVRPSSMESNWSLSLIAMDRLPALQSLAKDEGGYIDRVADKDTVRSPINAYFVPLDGNVLASISPAERSMVARWLRQPIRPAGAVTSAYITTVLGTLSDDTAVVMAMDLQDAYAPAAIRKWLADNDIQALESKNLDDLADVLSAMRGITLEIRVDDNINGTATVQFDRDASALNDCAKPIMIAILNYVGMHIDEVPNWKFAASGNAVTMQGELSNLSLRRLLSIVQSPVAAAAEVAPTSGRDGAGAGAEAPLDPGLASQRYYRAVCAILDGIQAGGSLSETATWIRSASKRIDQLPILNVDPALVDWGGLVSDKLKQAGAALAVGQTQIRSRVAGVMDPGYSYGRDSYGSTSGSASADRAASENARKQRQQAALEERAQAQQQALQIVSEIAVTRPKIRADMVAKYKIEF